jgi:DNA-binding MarR family transcriptional regulator
MVLHLARHLRREVHAVGSSVTAGQIEILGLIGGHPGVGVNELAGLVGISAPAMSNAIDKLEAAGLGLRTRETAGDRRRVGLSLTAEGARVVHAARTSRTAWLAGQLRELTPEQFEALEAALEPLDAMIGSRAAR